jgi:hypothetical protein
VVIELDDEQRNALYDLVDWRLSNLSTEIRHTDNRDLRRGLRQERELLAPLRDVLLTSSRSATG